MLPKAVKTGTSPQSCQSRGTAITSRARDLQFPGQARPIHWCFPGFLSTSQEVAAFTSSFFTVAELFGAGSGRMYHVVVHVVPSGIPPQHDHFWMQFYLQMGLQGGLTRGHCCITHPLAFFHLLWGLDELQKGSTVLFPKHCIILSA